MKKVTVFIISFLLFNSLIHAQQKGISATIGMATYNQVELTNYQDLLISRMPVEVKGLSYFPNYSAIRIGVFNDNQGFKYGFTYAFSTTGAHANYTDRSGYLNLDQQLTTHQVGFSGSYRLFYRNYFEMLVYGDLRFAYVRDRVSMGVTTYNYIRSNNLTLTAVSPMLEGGLEALYHFKTWSVGLEGGYILDPGVKYNIGQESLVDPTVSLRPSTDIKTQMSGFRGGLKIILWLTNEEESVVIR